MGQCNGLQVERRKRMGEPSLFDDKQNSGQSKSRKIDHHHGSASLVRSTMVPNTVSVDDRFPVCATSSQPNFSQANFPRTPEMPRMDNSRLAFIRSSLETAGLSEQAVDNFFKCWSESSHTDYENAWTRWVKFAQDRKGNPGDPPSHLFSEWTSELIDAGLGQSTVQKYASIVAQTIRLATGKNHYGELTQKFLKAAGKINTPKGKKYQTIWDINWGLNFVFKMFSKPKKYIEHVAQFIVVFRLLSGWRSSDLLGITRTNSIKKVEEGYFIRNWGTKTRQNSWSNYSFFPRIKNKNYTTFCIPSRIEALLKASDDFKFELLKIDNEWCAPLLSQAVPDKHTGLYHALAGNTIKQKVQRLFLDKNVNPSDHGKSLWDQGFRPHSLRHANASALRSLGVSAKDAATHQQTSEQSLENTYTTQVISDWDFPKEVLEKDNCVV